MWLLCSGRNRSGQTLPGYRFCSSSQICLLKSKDYSQNIYICQFVIKKSRNGGFVLCASMHHPRFWLLNCVLIKMMSLFSHSRKQCLLFICPCLCMESLTVQCCLRMWTPWPFTIGLWPWILHTEISPNFLNVLMQFSVILSWEVLFLWY